MKSDSEWITGQIKISIGGVPLEMQMTVPVKPVKPQRMLPVFQQMSNSFVEMGVKTAESGGESISCKAGCGACCRQAVPLAEIEAYQIAELVENLPEPRRSEIKERFEKAFAHFARIGWFERLQQCAGKSKEEQEKVVLEYFHENVACPFLIDESCSIHPERPLICREYLVTSPAVNCSNPSAEGVKLIEIPVKPSKTLRKIGRAEQIFGVDFIPLILSLKWAETHADEFPEKTGEQWMADFFQKLTNRPIPEKKNNSPKL
jgi:Fe-S-cluster containining protein